MSDLSLLSGVKRKSDFWAVRSAFDPGCVKTCTSQECAELFSLSSSLSSGRKHFWFSNLRNREGVSTRKLNVGVFTRPRPKADIEPDRLLRPTLTQTGATEAFQVVLPVRVPLDRYLVRDPSKRNIGLRATKL